MWQLMLLALLGDSFLRSNRVEAGVAALLGCCSVMLGQVGLQGAAKAKMVGYVPMYLVASPWSWLRRPA